MSSRFSIRVSTDVRALLDELAERSRPEAREVALLLLRLEREPEPPGSREFTPTLVERSPGERIWRRPDWTLTYAVDRAERLVKVGRVERTRGLPSR